MIGGSERSITTINYLCRDPHCLDLDNVLGFVLNVPTQPTLGPLTIPFVRRKHWIAVRYLAGAWHNLDSKAPQPEIVGETDVFLDWLCEQLKHDEKQVFVIVSLSTHRDQTYLHPPYRQQ